MGSQDVSLYAVGDVGAFFKHPEIMFEHVGTTLREADVAFAQNERHYTDRYTERDLLPGVPFTEISPVSHADALKQGGFHVLSFASNHCMDLGAQAMLDTIDVLQRNGFAVIGAGKNIEEARKPVVLERKGTRIALLAYCSVLRQGYEATASRAGCAPMRASTFYQQVDYQPGTPPAIISFAYPEDLDAMREDLRRAKQLSDVVVVSMHWGVHYVHGAIAIYQREVAHAAIDAGADLILGHHPHVLKGIEVYKGNAIFYSMGNFAFDLPLSMRVARAKIDPKKNHYNVTVDPEYAEMYAWPADSRRSMIVKCTISGKRISRLSFLPVLINTSAQPMLVSSGDDLREALRYITELSHGQGLETAFAIEGAEVVVATCLT